MEQKYPLVFSEWIKRRRKALDMTQDELAQRAGCSVSALRKIELGDRRPSKQLANLLAQALDIPKDEVPTFIRVARGELNLDRLSQPSLESKRQIQHTASLRQQPVSTLEAGAAPSSFQRISFQATPLIGREAELAAMARLFTDPLCRLLTLTGMGGIGKTRLAIEFAIKNEVDFPGGVFYFPLASVNSPEKIVPAIAEVLGFGFSGPADPKEQLLNGIASNFKQQTLFVFDNLEHLLVQQGESARQSSPGNGNGIIHLITEFLQRLPQLKILATSRERLNLHGEWTYELYGLSVPPANFVGELIDFDSIALLVKSAQRIRSGFQITAEEQPYLIMIAQLVEGIPLALELAAAWVGMLSCQEIAQEIQSNMDFLTTSMRDIPERHRSIRATFDHSWKLLSDEERIALCRLEVFQGGFDRTAAQQIAGAGLPLLASLCAKSLVHRAESGRYDLHQVIRQYALSHLVEQNLDYDVCKRHSEYYLNLVRECGKSLKSAAQQDTIRLMTGEIDNILAAWAWAIEQQEFDQLERAGRGFGWYFEITGLYQEGIKQIDLLLQALKPGSKADQPGRIQGLMLIHKALLNFRMGEFDLSRKLYEESLVILRPTGEQVLLADALCFLGTVLHLQGEYERARSLLQEGLMLARQNHELWYEAWAIYNLGHIDGLVGYYEQGYEQMMAGLAIWNTLGDPQSIALGLNFMVPTLIQLCRLEEAKAYMEQSIVLCEQAKNRWGMGTAYRFLGLAYFADGEFIEAQSHLQKSLEIFGEFSVGWDIARSQTYLGDTASMAGDLVQANQYYRDALQCSVEAHAVPITLDALVGLGELQAQAGKIQTALLFCAYILAHPSSESDTQNRAKKLQEFCKTRLRPEQITEACEQAQAMSLEAIVKFALEMD